MSQIEIRLPKMGESVTEATITNWLKEIGDTIELDEALVEVATDKVDNELPSEAEGILVQRFFEVDEVAQVGDVIAIISADKDATVAEKPTIQTKTKPAVIVAEPPKSNIPKEASILNKPTNGKFFSPLVKSIAEKEGMTMETLQKIPGSGQGGRVTKKDILGFIKSGATAVIDASTPAQNKQIKLAPINTGGFLANIKEPIVLAGPDDEIMEMDRMRKLIADHMIMSTHVSPHVTSYVEADVTNIWNWRNKVKNEFQSREGEKITFTPIFMEAIVKAIKDFPMVNVSVSGTQIIKRGHINIGMATALPSGNLIVPVIKDADRMNLVGITKSVNELAAKARNNKLKPEDIQDGTYTVTNVGTFGNVMGTPIINQPQVAILAIGAIRKVPAVIETPEGDFIGIRHKMFLSHSYDHRVVDGALGGQFVKRVADYLEQFDVNREL
ncbi:2-oxo acid dehydrogenase subunit E2 [Crocinitomicaceae bacterium]|nr:2-oxo acid dehydrogenase subunit E2 [Crocinitomicaceae bacterium]